MRLASLYSGEVQQPERTTQVRCDRGTHEAAWAGSGDPGSCTCFASRRLARRSTPLVDRSSGRFPAPAIIVFADNCIAVTRHARHTVIIIAAIFARLIASSLIAKRVTTRWRCRSGRRGCYRRRCLDWSGRCGCLTGRTRLRNHMRQRGRNRSIHVIARVIGDVADLGTVTRGPRRGCYVKLNGRQALVGGVVPLLFAAQLLRYRRFSCLDHPKVNIPG